MLLYLSTQDFHGAWDAYSGVNSPLYDSIHDPEPGWSVDGCVRNWVEMGAPKSKMNIGLGFYGRSFLNAKALHEPHGGTDDKTWAVDEGTPQYFVSAECLLMIVECSYAQHYPLDLLLEYLRSNEAHDNGLGR